MTQPKQGVEIEIDLLHESANQAQLEINDACKQMDSAGEVASSIAITFRQDAEALEASNTMLDFDSHAWEGAIGLLLVIAQAFARRLFLRRDTVGMNFRDALIALVG